jgi:type I restriction enzyme M protein
VLRDDGVTYHEYLTELTFVLFLKLAAELGIEERIRPAHRWASLLEASATEGGLTFYAATLDELGESDDSLLRSVFGDAQTRLRSNDALARLLSGVDGIVWTEAGLEVGDVYEGLIQKSAQEARYGAGQYFTPRMIVRSIVSAVQPEPLDVIYDPAAGTAGFLTAAGQYTDGATPTLLGVELSANVHRLGAANLFFHGLNATYVLGDALASDNAFSSCTVCITNPPFGVKGTLADAEAELLEFPTSNKQLAFLQHVYSRLAPNGRAAVIVPDNVLFESGVARTVRRRLLDGFGLHTILRLPPGIFYATGVKTSVLFFTAPISDTPLSSDGVWVYDLRSGGRRVGVDESELANFLTAYGSDPRGGAVRSPSNNFIFITRERIAEEDDRLDFGRDPLPESHQPSVAPQTQINLMRQELEIVSDALGELESLIREVRSGSQREWKL